MDYLDLVLVLLVACITISSTNFFHFQRIICQAKIGSPMIVILGAVERSITLQYVCFSSIALFIAMMTHHTRVLLHVGPKVLFGWHIPRCLRGRPIVAFYVTLFFYWISFARVQVYMIIAMITLRQTMLPETFTHANVSWVAVCFATVLLHMISKHIILLIHETDDGDIVCSICRDYLFVGQSISHLQCCHKYHQVCLDAWLLRGVSKTCPYCRNQI